MGAAACNAVCMSKKYQKPSDLNPIKVIATPTVHDLSSSMDNYEEHLEAQSELLAQKIDQKEGQIGINFVQNELINQYSKKHRETAIKTSRLQKWKDMIQYGLDSQSRDKVFKETPKRQEGDTVEAIEFTSYAMVGLKNFYRHHPEKFRDRLKKGPPAAYRWIAWKFMGQRILGKMKGRYENHIVHG